MIYLLQVYTFEIVASLSAGVILLSLVVWGQAKDYARAHKAMERASSVPPHESNLTDHAAAVLRLLEARRPADESVNIDLRLRDRRAA